MGTYREYSLEVSKVEKCKNSQFCANHVIQELRKENENAEYAFNEHGDFLQSLKWYKHEQDLKDFSKKYPDYVFELSVLGDDLDDIWKKYFHDGRVQICKAIISFENFDKNKLE